jgi:2-dehydro-3-deoxyphosphogluconate aldolase/(4S)-4-hydroxy-2-oxoglutarate aldolase
VAKTCHELSVPYLPGGATPGEILHHWQSGATVVKIFPAREIGGPKFLGAVRAVFPDIPLMPTGGVKPENVGEYLDAGAICAGLGGELFPAGALEAGDEAGARAAIEAASAAMGPS